MGKGGFEMRLEEAKARKGPKISKAKGTRRERKTRMGDTKIDGYYFDFRFWVFKDPGSVNS